MSGLEFAMGIIVMSTLGWVITTWIRARHGYPVENEWKGMVHKGEAPESARKIEALSNENAGLRSQVGGLEERLRVLERIATDPSERTAREIEQLRD